MPDENRKVHLRRYMLPCVLGLYLALAVSSTWPLARDLGDSLPLGTEDNVTVTMASAWALWWTADRLAVGLQDYWDAPIFHPEKSTFALSEPMPLLGFVAAPLFWLGASPAGALGILVLVCLVVNGLAAFGLLRRCGIHPLAAVTGGAMLVLLPFVHDQLGVMTLLPLAGILWTLRALMAFADRSSYRRGALVGLAFAATYLMCAQVAVFVFLAALPAVFWLVPKKQLRLGLLGQLAPGLVVAAVLILPVGLAQYGATSAHGFQRKAERAHRGSASVPVWATAQWSTVVPLPPVISVARRGKRALFPGIYKLVLAVLGVLWAWRRPDLRRKGAFLATLAGAAIAVSMLPRLDLGAASPYLLLREVIPGLAHIRSVWRMGVLAHLAFALLAAFSLHCLITGWLQRIRRERGMQSVRLGWALVAVLAVMATVELWPRGQVLVPAPSLTAWQPFVTWVEREVEPGEAILHLPLPSRRSAHRMQETTVWMYVATAHGRPLANGYSSYWPESYKRLGREVRDFPGPSSVQALRQQGIRFVVVRASWLSRGRPAPGPPWWRLRKRFEELDILVYELAAG